METEFSTLADQIEATGRALTADELAELLSVSRVSIFKQAKAGRIPSFRVASSVRFCPSIPTEPTVTNQIIQQQAQNPVAGVSPTQPPSRLQSVLGAVANVVSTGLAGIPNQGRPSFVTGLGSGARSEQAAQAQQQAIKFKTFEDSVRAAQLTNEETRMQWASEDHQEAVQANADAQAKRMTASTGMTYTFVPNDDGGKTALDHMGVQMAQNGSVSVPAGTISGPKGWYIPNQGSAEQAQALTADFNARAPFYGFNPVPKGSVVNGLAYDQLRQASNGLDNQGHPMSPTDLNTRIDNMSAQLAQYKKGANTDPQLIQSVQSDIAHLQDLSKHYEQRNAAAFKQSQAQQLDTLNKSEAIRAKYAEEKQDNAAGDKAANAGAGKPGSVVGFDPQSNQRVVVNAGDPKAGTLQQSAKVTPQQLDQWGTSQNQFANVQLAVSRYDQSARNFAQNGKPSDIVGINSALNQSGLGDIKIGEWGVKVPGFSSFAEATSRVANSTAFKNLSPAGQDLVDKYFRMMSSIPEYQKAATGIGRTNKEMLDLELKNIPDPTMPPGIISNRLGSFQEALSSNASRVPRIQGVPHYQDVQQHYQPQTPAPSGGSNLGRSVMGNPNDVINRLQPTR